MHGWSCYLRDNLPNLSVPLLLKTEGEVFHQGGQVLRILLVQTVIIRALLIVVSRSCPLSYSPRQLRLTSTMLTRVKTNFGGLHDQNLSQIPILVTNLTRLARILNMVNVVDVINTQKRENLVLNKKQLEKGCIQGPFPKGPFPKRVHSTPIPKKGPLPKVSREKMSSQRMHLVNYVWDRCLSSLASQTAKASCAA